MNAKAFASRRDSAGRRAAPHEFVAPQEFRNGDGTVVAAVRSFEDAVEQLARLSDAVDLLLGGLGGDQPAITAPADGTAIPRGAEVTVTWTAVDGAVQYLVEFVGGSFSVSTTGFTAMAPFDIPAGTHRIRVIGLTATGDAKECVWTSDVP